MFYSCRESGNRGIPVVDITAFSGFWCLLMGIVVFAVVRGSGNNGIAVVDMM